MTIEEIIYSPVSNTIDLSFSVRDRYYQHAEYFVILQEKGHQITRKSYSFRVDGKNDETKNIRLELDNRTKEYRILIGKTDTDNLNLMNERGEASAWIEWEDPHFTERKKVELGGGNALTPPVTDDLSGSYVSSRWAVGDLDAAVTSFTAVLRQTNTKDQIAVQIDDDFDRYAAMSLSIDFLFSNLAPNTAYTIDLYVSGNDGFDDFSNLYLGSKSLLSADFSDNNESNIRWGTNFHYLHGTFYQVEYSSTEMTISYIYGNGYVYRDEKTNELLELHLEIRDKQNVVTHTYPLEIGIHQIVVLLSEINPGYEIVITNQNMLYFYDRYLIEDITPNQE